MTDWKFKFRQDQCEFIIAAMDYIAARSDEHSGVGNREFVRFAAERTKERAIEIRDKIQSIIT